MNQKQKDWRDALTDRIRELISTRKRRQERSVIRDEDDIGGRARVMRDEKRVL